MGASRSSISHPLDETLEGTEYKAMDGSAIDNYQGVDVSLDEQKLTTTEERFNETVLELRNIENLELYNAALKEYKDAVNDCIEKLKTGRQKETISSLNTTSSCVGGPSLALDGSKAEESCVRLLQMTVDKQSELIKELCHILRKLAGSESCKAKGRVSSLERKMETLLEQVAQLSSERFCEGRCAKHGKTEKCFCRGFSQPHRCCGRLGNVCEC